MGYFKKVLTATQEKTPPYFCGTKDYRRWLQKETPKQSETWIRYDRRDYATIICFQCGKDTPVAYAKNPYAPYYCPVCKKEQENNHV